MEAFKQIGKGILFLITGFTGTILVQAIITLSPLYVGLWLFRFSDFWFYFIGSLLITLYYYIAFGGLGIFFYFINKLKFDYWFSNIFLALTSFLYYYLLISFLVEFFGNNINSFLNFKGIILLITLIPVYIYLIFITVLSPFTKEDWN